MSNTNKYRGQTDCILKSIVIPSPAIISPTCKYFGVCGGCLIQHLKANEYAQFKFNLIKALLDKEDIQTDINPLISIPFGQRRRANLEVLKKNDKIYLGFHRFHSNQIINIDECPAILNSLSNLLVPLKEILHKILNNKQKAQVFLNQASNGIDILFKIKDPLSLTTIQLNELKNFAKQYKILKIVFESTDSRTVIYESEAPYISFNEINVKVEADSFLQASFLSDQIFTQLVLGFFLNNNNIGDKRLKIADFFCGRGTFTIPLSQHFNIDGFESDNNSLEALNKAAATFNLSINLENRNLFASPLSPSLLNDYNCAVINLPRAGAQAQCIEFAKSTIEKIAYVSCNPISFIDDAKTLLEGGYQLIEVTPVDQFPYTPHLEIVSFFQKPSEIYRHSRKLT